MLTLDSANIIFAGHFNPYLITPEWLSKVAIWRPNEAHLLLGGMPQDVVRFNGDGVEWQLASNRLTISSTGTDCGALARQLLEKLPHTPVFAAGSNFVFQDPELTLDHPAFKPALDVFPLGNGQPELFKWSTVLHEQDVRVEVTCIAGEQGASFSVSRPRRTASIESALRAVSAFLTDRDYAADLVERLVDGVKR